MNKICRKPLAILLAVVVLLPILSIGVGKSSASSLAFDVTAGNLAEVSNAVSAAGFGDVITVIGNLNNLTETIALNIPPNVIVRWQASIASALNAYIFNISGGGTFEVRDATILSSGTRTTGVINAIGSATITIAGGAEITAVNTGNPILVSADYVTVNIDGGTVLSSSRNSNAAIQVGSGSTGNVLGTQINVRSGSVISDVGGYAINDGAGVGNVGNNTAIAISGGIVSSGSACAIHSTGMWSNVKISGGLVTNTAASNANPTIYMNSDPAYWGFRNVIISGGKVQNLSPSTTGYAIQTTSDVYITGGGVFTINGRAINLVGINSTVTVSGTGIVHAAGSGTAISTATTAGVDVSNTTISILSGGVASSESGPALRVTGTYTLVRVGEDGRVWSGAAAGGSVIQVESSAHNSTINVDGGFVDATDAAHAIYVAGTTHADVRVAGGRVTAKAGYAIRTNGTVSLSGGFVFAYRQNAHEVIQYGGLDVPSWSTAIVVSWNQGSKLYPEGSFESANPDLDVAYNGTYRNFFWHNSPNEGGGIYYEHYPTRGFFPLAHVSVYSDYGLIFDARTLQLLRADTGEPFMSGQYVQWNIQNIIGQGPTLILNGFSWATSAGAALTVIGDSTHKPFIQLNGESVFESTEMAGTGINATGNSLTIVGGGTLIARGSGAAGVGLNLNEHNLGIRERTTFIAQGWGRAVDWVGFDYDGSTVINPFALYYRWAYSQRFEGIGTPEERRPALDSPIGYWDEGFSTVSQFEFWRTDRFVELQALDPIRLESAVQIGGAEGLSDSTAIVLTFSDPVSGLTAADITITGAAYATPDAVVFGIDNMWTIVLDAVYANNADALVSVSHFGRFYINPNTAAAVVYKAAGDIQTFMLTVRAQPPEGGDTSMSSRFNQTPQFQFFLAGTYIEVIAEASSGFAFVGWAIEGAVLEGDPRALLASFDMPQGNVVLTANFASISGGGDDSGDFRGGAGNVAGPPPAGEGAGETIRGQICVDGCYEDCVDYCVTYVAMRAAGNSDVSHLLNTQRHRPFIQGIGYNLFAPGRDMTRAEVAQMFFNLLIEQDVEITRHFPDEVSRAWHERAVHTLASLGILEGYPDGSFRPEEPVTRAQFVTIAVRFAYSLPEDVVPSPFHDLSEDHWAYRHIRVALQFGWIAGYGDGSFRPDVHLSRAEAVAIVTRMLGRIPDRQYIDAHPELPQFDDVPATHWAFYYIMEAYIPHAYHIGEGEEDWI